MMSASLVSATEHTDCANSDRRVKFASVTLSCARSCAWALLRALSIATATSTASSAATDSAANALQDAWNADMLPPTLGGEITVESPNSALSKNAVPTAVSKAVHASVAFASDTCLARSSASDPNWVSVMVGERTEASTGNSSSDGENPAWKSAASFTEF